MHKCCVLHISGQPDLSQHFYRAESCDQVVGIAVAKAFETLIVLSQNFGGRRGLPFSTRAITSARSTQNHVETVRSVRPKTAFAPNCLTISPAEKWISVGVKSAEWSSTPPSPSVYLERRWRQTDRYVGRLSGIRSARLNPQVTAQSSVAVGVSGFPCGLCSEDLKGVATKSRSPGTWLVSSCSSAFNRHGHLRRGNHPTCDIWSLRACSRSQVINSWTLRYCLRLVRMMANFFLSVTLMITSCSLFLILQVGRDVLTDTTSHGYSAPHGVSWVNTTTIAREDA